MATVVSSRGKRLGRQRNLPGRRWGSRRRAASAVATAALVRPERMARRSSETCLQEILGRDRAARRRRRLGPAAAAVRAGPDRWTWWPGSRSSPPSSAWTRTAMPPEALTPVEQEPLPDGPLDESLAQVGWPREVAGCALVQEVVMLPPEVEEAMPRHVGRRRLGQRAPGAAGGAGSAVAVLRDGSRACTVRLRGPGRGRPAGRPGPGPGAGRRARRDPGLAGPQQPVSQPGSAARRGLAGVAAPRAR